MKRWLFEKISKIDKPLARLMEKKKLRTLNSNIRNERGIIIADSIDIKWTVRIL